MIHRPLNIITLAAIAVAKPLAIRQDAPNNTSNGTMAWSFKEVPSSANLQYVPCFQNFTCANLEVPLDYDKPDVGTINIAFIKYPAAEQPALGDVIMNPGGPGGSGVQYVMKSAAKSLVPIIGTKYNIIGMDPRGVNNSGPNLDCFDGTPAVRDYYDVQYYSVIYRDSKTSLAMHLQDAGAFGDWCSQTLKEDAKYANTPATARDMLQYAEKLAESQGKPCEEAKLDYYGVSYGSTLGTTYAAMFPDRINRMVIDGVVDVEDHYGGSWTQNLLQADEAIEDFFKMCHEAGPACSFFHNDSSPAEIKKRFDALLKDLETNPVPISDPNIVEFPTTITSQDIRGIILTSIYSAIDGFPKIADILSGLEKRNATDALEPLAANGATKGYAPPSQCNWKGDDYSATQPKLLIACTDQHGNYNISTLDKYEQYIDELEGISPYLGDIWAQVITPNCWKLPYKPVPNQEFKGS